MPAPKPISKDMCLAAMNKTKSVRAAARYLNWRINRQVNNEDTKLINLVQEGMNTNYFKSGPLASSEVCLIDSANKIREAIPLSSQETEPKEL